MSQNAVHLAMRARGMGVLGGTWDVGSDGVPFYDAGGGSSGGGFDWGSIVAPITQFGTTFLAAWRDRGVAQAGINPNAQQQAFSLAAQQAAAAAAAARDNGDDSGSGFGLAFTDKGLRLGEKTTLSYPVIGLGIAAIVLLQSSGFQKRGR